MNKLEQDTAGHRKRLKERYMESGTAGLLPYECVELLLTYAVPRRDVKPLAKSLIREFKSLKGILDADLDELQRIDGIGSHTALLFKIIRDCSDLYLREEVIEGEIISSPQALIRYCRSAMAGLKDEQFRCIFLNTKNKVLADEIIQEGIVSQTIVYPRKIVERAIYQKASALILVHNHPSGDLTPSREDLNLTETLKKAVCTLNINIHDHLIVSSQGHFSFREHGLL